MQAPASLIIAGAILLIAGLSLGLSVIISAPILAVPFFLFGVILFFLWRSSRNMPAPLPEREGVPTTEEAAGDPVRDSGAGVVGRRNDSR
jgi:hypothetical protein